MRIGVLFFVFSVHFCTKNPKNKKNFDEKIGFYLFKNLNFSVNLNKSTNLCL